MPALSNRPTWQHGWPSSPQFADRCRKMAIFLVAKYEVWGSKSWLCSICCVHIHPHPLYFFYPVIERAATKQHATYNKTTGCKICPLQALQEMHWAKEKSEQCKTLNKMVINIKWEKIGKENHMSGLKPRFSHKPLVHCLPAVGFVKYMQRLNIGHCRKCDLWARGTRGCVNNFKINALCLWKRHPVWKDLSWIHK